MFEFGRDLRKLFAQARESEDLGWVELIGADLLLVEARREGVDAGRVSCARPFETERRAAALWREHARRTGAGDSLDRADRAALSLAQAAADEEHCVRAAIEAALARLLRFDLRGGPEHLDAGLAALAEAGRARQSRTAAQAAAVHARLRARQARLSADPARLLEAAALMDAALHGSACGAETDELRLDRAALALEAGVVQRDPRLLDQAGRDLGALVEACSADQRPLTRARALALCGAGLAALAALAGHVEAHAQGRMMFEAAADQFTPDHSPLDWVAIQVLRAREDALPLMPLTQAEALTQGRGLVLGALVRERRLAREAELAMAVGDLSALDLLDGRIRARLAKATPLDWAADQIALARIAVARRAAGVDDSLPVGLLLVEAETTAREWGAPALADRAAILRDAL